MLIEQPPRLLRRLYPRALWRMNPAERTVYLTFDDGPVPEVTPWVLDVLDHFGVRATFFLVGDNVRKHPDTYRLILDRGHRTGNHTFNHLRGFEYSTADYVANVEQAAALAPSDLFRPPHGHLLPAQYHALAARYRIVMWDLVTRDYSRRLTPRQVLRIVKRYARPGAIVTFHDSLKAERNLRYALPRAIRWLQEQGYTFKVFD